MTNRNVIEGADEIEVTMKDGNKYKAEVIGADPESDVAVIKIDAENLPIIELGDSDALQIGEWVIAVGNPFGLTETVTVGVVSAKGRSGFGVTDYEDFIQTDAAINPGNSGGPLLNLDGEVIGLNTFIVSQSGGYMGISFAIPINMAKAVKDQLLASGKVTRGYIGILMNPDGVTPELAEEFGLEKNGGVLISQVEEDGPAEKAGILPGDIIIKMNDKEIKGNDQFRNTVSLMAPGTKVDLTVYRNGREKKLTVELGSLSESTFAGHVSEIARKLGFQVRELTKDLAQRFGYEAESGVIISGVTQGSEADKAGIELGMLILSVNRQDVSSVAEFNEAIKETEESKRALLLIRHDRITEWLLLRLKD